MGESAGTENWHSPCGNGQLDHDGLISCSSMTFLEDLSVTDAIPPAEKSKWLIKMIENMNPGSVSKVRVSHLLPL